MLPQIKSSLHLYSVSLCEVIELCQERLEIDEKTMQALWAGEHMGARSKDCASRVGTCTVRCETGATTSLSD
jgi:hypothetical protein